MIKKKKKTISVFLTLNDRVAYSCMALVLPVLDRFLSYCQLKLAVIFSFSF